MHKHSRGNWLNADRACNVFVPKEGHKHVIFLRTQHKEVIAVPQPHYMRLSSKFVNKRRAENTKRGSNSSSAVGIYIKICREATMMAKTQSLPPTPGPPPYWSVAQWGRPAALPKALLLACRLRPLWWCQLACPLWKWPSHGAMFCHAVGQHCTRDGHL